jgi:hypothetical protein
LNELNATDIIQLVTTKNVYYISAPPGKVVSPQGNWIVTGFVERDVIAAKEGTIIRVPVRDVRRVARYSMEELFRQLKKAALNTESIDVVSRISSEMGWKPDVSRKFLFKFNLPETAENEVHLSRIMDYARKIVTQGENDG